jgi:hypothetical protein
LQALDARWVLTTLLSFSEVWLVDGTKAVTDRMLYNGSQIFDVNTTSDGRLLLTDYGLDVAMELTPSGTPSATDPVGLPLVVGRTVAVSNPYAVMELLDGNWLIGGATGLFIYDPVDGTLVNTLTTDCIRTIEHYTGM